MAVAGGSAPRVRGSARRGMQQIFVCLILRLIVIVSPISFLHFSMITPDYYFDSLPPRLARPPPPLFSFASSAPARAEVRRKSEAVRMRAQRAQKERHRRVKRARVVAPLRANRRSAVMRARKRKE